MESESFGQITSCVRFWLQRRRLIRERLSEENPNNVSKVFCSDPETMDPEKITKYFESCGNVVDTYWLYDKKTAYVEVLDL